MRLSSYTAQDVTKDVTNPLNNVNYTFIILQSQSSC